MHHAHDLVETAHSGEAAIAEAGAGQPSLRFAVKQIVLKRAAEVPRSKRRRNVRVLRQIISGVETGMGIATLRPSGCLVMMLPAIEPSRVDRGVNIRVP